MANIKQVIQQMRTLVSEPENRGHIVKDQSCINMLKLSLEEKDEEIVSNALDILFFITVPKENRATIANHPEVMRKVKSLMTDFQSSPQCRKQSSRIWENLQDVIEENNKGSSTTSGGVGLLGLRNANSVNIGLGSGFGVLSKNENKPPIQTYTFAVKGLVDDKSRSEIETALIKVVGVISFSVNTTERKVTVRSHTPSSIVASAIRTSGYTNVAQLPDNKENTNDEEEPGYLPENHNNNNPNSQGSWLYSLISFGAPQQEESRKKKSQTSGSSWFGRGMMRSLAETLNIS